MIAVILECLAVVVVDVVAEVDLAWGVCWSSLGEEGETGEDGEDGEDRLDAEGGLHGSERSVHGSVASTHEAMIMNTLVAPDVSEMACSGFRIDFRVCLYKISDCWKNEERGGMYRVML